MNVKENNNEKLYLCSKDIGYVCKMYDILSAQVIKWPFEYCNNKQGLWS